MCVAIENIAPDAAKRCLQRLFSVFLPFQRRHLQMYKQYANTVRIVVTQNDE